jgi:predicted TIM-barrel fold metal-dependent hydrolase
VFQDLHIVDFHAHLAVPGDVSHAGHPDRDNTDGEDPDGHEGQRLRDEQSAVAQKRWRQAYDFPEPETDEHTPAEQGDRWVAELDRYGIDRICFVTGGGNDTLAGVVAAHPDRFAGMAHHDPTVPDAAAELERVVGSLGLHGYKLFAPRVEIPLGDRRLYPVWEACERLSIPVLIHFGMLGAAGGVSHHPNISPVVLEPVARDFPTVDFVVPHFGIQHVADLLFLCWSCSNVHVDTSGSNQWVRWMPYPLTLDDLFRKFYETIGPHRLLFGSDSSWFPRGFANRYLQDQVRIARLMNMPDDEVALIFGGNARRLLRLR